MSLTVRTSVTFASVSVLNRLKSFSARGHCSVLVFFNQQSEVLRGQLNNGRDKKNLLFVSNILVIFRKRYTTITGDHILYMYM